MWLGSPPPPQFFKSECQLAILSVESLGEEGESQSSIQLLKFLPALLIWLKCGQFTSQNLKLGNFCILSSSNKLESWWHFLESVSPVFILFSSVKLCNVDAVPFTAQKKCTCLPVLWTYSSFCLSSVTYGSHFGIGFYHYPGSHTDIQEGRTSKKWLQIVFSSPGSILTDFFSFCLAFQVPVGSSKLC